MKLCPGSRSPATATERVIVLMYELTVLYGKAWADRELERSKASPLTPEEWLTRAKERAAIHGPEPIGERPVGFLR